MNAAIRWRLLAMVVPIVVSGVPATSGTFAASGSGRGPGVGVIPQGVQSDTAFARSFLANQVTNVFVTDRQASCYRPEVPAPFNDGPNDGYTGETGCTQLTTREDPGLVPYPTQAGSSAGFPAATPMQVKDKSESDIRVDPTNPNHLIGSSKWFVDAEGYNHLLGFYESFDGGKTWPVMGHIPGYEGWTENTDPVGAFDRFGNYYELILPYMFTYSNSGGHQFSPGQQPNPTLPNEAVSIAVRPHGATGVTQWVTTQTSAAGVSGPDYVTTTDASFGQEPDKQWITIDANPASPNVDTIYAMWVVFNGFNSKAFVATARALPNGTHTDWSAPIGLPDPSGTNSNTYLLPHVTPDGTAWTSITNFPGQKSKCCVNIGIDRSTDGGKTWQLLPTPAASNVIVPVNYANTTFRTGIENTFAAGNHLSPQGHFPLYVAYEDFSAGITNVVLTASFDGGASWAPIQVNDNASPADEFQPNLAVAVAGTVSVNFYDRRLACPAQGTVEAAQAGLVLDQVNPVDANTPPYGATNYCINGAIQFYRPDLAPLGNNIRLTQNSWDPQLNSPHWIAFNVSGAGDTFIGDYFGNTFSGSTSISSLVSTVDDGLNPQHYQQQVVATVAIPSVPPGGD